MAITPLQEKIQKAVALALNVEMAPATRIDAARKYLKISNCSARAQRIGKRIAKLYLKDPNTSKHIRNKATNLLAVALKKQSLDNEPDDIENVEAADPTPAAPVNPGSPSAPKVWTLEDYNRGWDASPVPKKFICYYEPADLPGFEIAADPDLAPMPHREGKTLAIATDLGGKYWVDFGGVCIGGKNKNYILNPRYVAEFEKWKAIHPHGEPFTGEKPSPENIFNYECYLSRYNANGDCPVMMMFVPMAPAYVDSSQQ